MIVTYFQPANFDITNTAGLSQFWVRKILGDAANYQIQSVTATQATLLATPVSGYGGQTVVLKGTFTPTSATLDGQATSLELFSASGALVTRISDAAVNVSVAMQGFSPFYPNNIEFIGSPGDDVIKPGTLVWKIDAGAGNDLVVLSQTNTRPTIIGGPGNDTIHSSASSASDWEWVVAGDGADQIFGNGKLYEVDLREAKGFIEVWVDQPNDAGDIRIDNARFINSGAYGSVVHGGWRDDYVTGRGGNDTLEGGAGMDVLRGGQGDDYLDGGVGDDFLRDSYALDGVYLEGGNNTMMGGVGNDTIYGDIGADLLRGGEGADSMLGDKSFDDMHGNQGTDTMRGGDGGDWVVGGQDGDHLYGDAGDDIVHGSMGSDSLTGGDGADQIRGGQHDDVMLGEAGNDWMSGDRGDDTITGGSGADIFHTFVGAGIDRVTDFSSAAGDRVLFETRGTAYTLSFVGDDTVIDLGGGTKMILVGVTQASLGDWLTT